MKKNEDNKQVKKRKEKERRAVKMSGQKTGQRAKSEQMKKDVRDNETQRETK